MEYRNSVSCSLAGPNPSLEQSLNQLHIRDALCDNRRSHRLDTSRISSQNAFTPFQNLRGLCEPMRILVAEDDAPLAELLHERLEQEQFAVQVVSNGAEAQQLASDQAYDLVILDLNLPGSGGLDVLRGIRSKRPDLPVVIVTVASMVEERVRGLDAGADDYVAKPFAFAELAARIRAVLRRGSRPARAILQIGDLEVDRVSHTVRRGNHNIDLSYATYRDLIAPCMRDLASQELNEPHVILPMGKDQWLQRLWLYALRHLIESKPCSNWQ
jgi:CheY-like chemotaxis protein